MARCDSNCYEYIDNWSRSSERNDVPIDGKIGNDGNNDDCVKDHNNWWDAEEIDDDQKDSTSINVDYTSITGCYLPKDLNRFSDSKS